MASLTTCDTAAAYLQICVVYSTIVVLLSAKASSREGWAEVSLMYRLLQLIFDLLLAIEKASQWIGTDISDLLPFQQGDRLIRRD